MRTTLSLVTGIALALVAPTALAQTQAGPPPMAPAAPPQYAPAPAPAAPEDPRSDHERYAVGHLAVGYMGFMNIPLDNAPGNYLQAPAAGVRYWLNDRMGIDAGIGLAFTSGSTKNTNGNQTTTTDDPSQLGLALHGGVPLALAHYKHYKFLIVPEANIALAHSNEKVAGANDISHNGFHFDIGARVGAEIHFGFMGVPQLSLQASLGLLLKYDHWSQSTDLAGGGKVSGSINKTSLATTAYNNPWDIFAGNIFALYYF